MAATHGPAVTKGSFLAGAVTIDRGAKQIVGAGTDTATFLAGAHRELSVALIKCQGSVHRGCANLLAKAAGHQVSPGAEIPYQD